MKIIVNSEQERTDLIENIRACLAIITIVAYEKDISKKADTLTDNLNRIISNIAVNNMKTKEEIQAKIEEAEINELQAECIEDDYYARGYADALKWVLGEDNEE